MIGAIIGDIIGSRYEFSPTDDANFELFGGHVTPTDDSMMTLAVALSLLEADGDKALLERKVVENMQYIGRRYPYAGYGGNFAKWIMSDDPKPYYSYGNGSAMRVSPVAHVASSLDEAIELANIVSRVTHNHPEGIKGGECIAGAVYIALHGGSKDDIKSFVENGYYKLDRTLSEIRPSYRFHVDCMQSVPEAIECFMEADSFEETIRNVVMLHGDSDTQGAMALAIAEGYYGVPLSIRKMAVPYLDEFMLDILHRFEKKYGIYTDMNM